METITINKNRGWRGLAEIKVRDGEGEEMTYITSFSPNTWNDLVQKGIVVIAKGNTLYAFELANKPSHLVGHQRSVLIKNFTTPVRLLFTNLISEAYTSTSPAIEHFLMNRQNHTTSEWNNVGIRVRPNVLA